MVSQNSPPIDERHSDPGPDPLVTHRTDDDTPTSSVIEAVATVTGRESTTLGPLYDAIDPDALNRLCGSGSSETCSVSFRFEGCDVTVHSGGQTIVSRLSDHES